MGHASLTVVGTLFYLVSFGQPINIGNLTIELPSAPEIQKNGDKTLYMVVDSSYIINVVIADMQDNKDFNITPNKLAEFYRGVIDGIMNAATDPKLLSEVPINIHNYEAREIRYTKDFNEWEDIPVTKWILLVDKVLYTFDIWDLSKRGQEKLEKQIFESITVR